MTTHTTFSAGEDVIPIFGGARMSIVDPIKTTAPGDVRCRWESEFNGDVHELNLPSSMLRPCLEGDWNFDEGDDELTCDGLMLMQEFAWLIETLVADARSMNFALPDWRTSAGVIELVRALTARKHHLRA